MHRTAVTAVLAALLLAAPAAFADDAKVPDAKVPDAARVRAAAEHFDAGVTAFKEKDYDGAASHFEAADAAVPSPKALRQAIRARVEAGQGSRAATLAALALRVYASDEATSKLATETIEKLEPSLYKVDVSCASPCVLSVGTRPVPGEASARWIVYLDPGKERVRATFSGGAGSAQREVTATEGGAKDLRFEPADKAPVGVLPVPVKDDPGKNEAPPDEPAPDDAKPQKKGISPAFFAVSAAATVVLGVTTIWSGVDTQNNPGADAVKAACEGKGPDCPLFKEGLAKQARTNALVGATAGVAAVTVVLAIFTRWHGDKKPAATEPTAFVTDRGAVFGAAGVF